jgi:putative salt-induced outer membrane protein YdiY
MKYLFANTILVCLIQITSGQIVNIENIRLHNQNKKGISGNMEVSFNFTKNTRYITQLGNRNRLYYLRQNDTWMLLTDLNYVSSNRQQLVNNGFQHLRYSYNLKKYKFIVPEAFQQTQYNAIQLIKLRLLAGAGARTCAINKDSVVLSLGTFLMGEYEKEADNRINRHIRYSLFISFDYQFNKYTGLNLITYYQPDLLGPEDYRVSNETGIRIKITDKLKYKLVYNLTYDKYPPMGAPQTLYFINNVLNYEL